MINGSTRQHSLVLYSVSQAAKQFCMYLILANDIFLVPQSCIYMVINQLYSSRPKCSLQCQAAVGSSALLCICLWGLNQMWHIYILRLEGCAPWSVRFEKCLVLGTMVCECHDDGYKAREKENTMRAWQQGRKRAYFFEDCFKFLFTNFPSHHVAFFSKLKTKPLPFIWYYLFWWRHKDVGLHCVLFPEIWYFLPEKTGRTSEDINWQQNNP